MKLPAHLRTERLVLRPPELDDAAAIYSNWAADAEVTRYLVWRPHGAVDETIAFLRRNEAERRAGTVFPWMITERDEGVPVGMIDLRRRAPGEDELDFGYVLARRVWGRGYATEALRAVLAAAFAHCGVRRIWAVCDVDNAASARVMEKAGLVREGLRRGAVFHPNLSDRPRDVYCYAITRAA